MNLVSSSSCSFELESYRVAAECFRLFYMEIEIEIWMLRDERHVSAFRQVTLVAQASLPYSQLR
jgi:hypothetical protein